MVRRYYRYATFRLDIELLDKLSKYASASGQTKTQTINDALEEYLYAAEDLKIRKKGEIDHFNSI